MGRRGRTIIKLTLGCALFHLVVFSAVFRRPVTQWKKESYDCAVVCGYPACEDGKPSRIMRTRVERAVELWKAGRVGLLLFSGGAAANSFVEADVMKEYAEALGAEPDAILTERRSVSTYHNMKYSREVMEEHGLKDCVVVTNRWHFAEGRPLRQEVWTGLRDVPRQRRRRAGEGVVQAGCHEPAHVSESVSGVLLTSIGDVVKCSFTTSPIDFCTVPDQNSRPM